MQHTCWLQFLASFRFSIFSEPPQLTSRFEQRVKGTEKAVIMGYAQLVIGPAGSGKSTYCSSLHQHCETTRRTIHIVNLDPAAENFDYPVAMDIRELISLDDVMEELGLGPNGGLMYCMEYPSFRGFSFSEFCFFSTKISKFCFCPFKFVSP